MENEIKVFGGNPEDVPYKYGEVIVPGNLVCYSAAGWIKMTDQDYEEVADIPIAHVGLAVGYSDATGKITLGGAKQDHIDAKIFGKLAIVKFGSNWEAQGALTRKAEALAIGDKLSIEDGKFEKIAIAAGGVGEYALGRVWAEVIEGNTATDGNIKISTNGCPYGILSAIGT
jgi:hypothetical protein